jgi:hypothetical protein
MKKSIGLLMFAGLVFSAVSAQAAYTSILIRSFTATASVGAVNTFTAQPLTIATNATATGFTFGAQSNGAPYISVPLEYMSISVNDNSALWKLQTYTNDFATQPSTTTWGLSYGGLIGATAGDKVSMVWQVLTSTVAGGPVLGVLPGQTGSFWTYFKDKMDVQSNTGLDTTSFAAAQAAGYCNIAYGGASIGTTAIVDSATGGQVALPSKQTPFDMYVRGDFSTAPADPTYTGTVIVELYHP